MVVFGVLQLRTHALLSVMLILSSNPALAARRALKKKVEKVESSLHWYGSADATYNNWLKDKLEGGGESRVAGVQLGLNLPNFASAYMRVSATPDPHGFQDIRVGFSRGIEISETFRDTLSTSFSVPTSEYSQSIRQKTQASVATTLEHYRGALTMSLTLYGTQAYYTEEPEAYEYTAALALKPAQKPNQKQRRAPSRSPLTPVALESDDGTEETVEVNYSDVIYLTRFDKLAGAALDFTYRFPSEWAVGTSGSITKTMMSSGEPIWSSELTLLTVSWSYKSYSVYASTGLLDSGEVLHVPTFQTYTIGMSTYFPN